MDTENEQQHNDRVSHADKTVKTVIDVVMGGDSDGDGDGEGAAAAATPAECDASVDADGIPQKAKENATETGAATTTPLTMTERIVDLYKNESARFALRITAAMTASSLFVLLSSPVPEPTFIQITAGVVCWQPTDDIGSVIKKSWQRTLGTTVGGLIGLGIGAISLFLVEPSTSSEGGGSSSTSSSSQQALFLGVMTTLVNYILTYYATSMGLRAHYSALLGTLTAGFVALAFFDKSRGDDAWVLGVFRIVNIIIGGLIGSICSVLIFPQSTKRLVETKVESQSKITGTAAKEVLSMAVKLIEGTNVPTYQEIVKNDDIQDAAHSAYISAILNVKDIKSLFALLVYDPLFRRLHEDQQKNFISTNRIKLGRLLRTQMNIVQIDNIVRSGTLKGDPLNTDLLQRVGDNIETLLDRSNSQKVLDETSRRLLTECLPSIKKEVDSHVARTITASGHQVLRRDTSTFSDEDLSQILSNFDDIPQQEFIDVFFGLGADMLYRHVETLIVRCLRLHHIWPLQKL